MALIEEFHTHATQHPIDPSQDAENNPIIEGQIVSLNAQGYVKAAGKTDAFGIAGDSFTTGSAGTPFAADIVINGRGTTQSTQNRVSDFFDETRASGMMTVYHSGGQFFSDQWDESATFTAGQPIYSNASGEFTNDSSGSARVVGLAISPGPEPYPSGVPGATEGISVDGHQQLGNTDFLNFQLNIIPS